MDLQTKITQHTTYKKILEDKVNTLSDAISINESNRDIDIKSRWVLTEVSKLTQESFQDKVEVLLTLAIRSVFNRDLDFKLKFEKKRNKLEVLPVVIEDGDEFNLKEDDGGSIIDIISFAFRVVLWSMENPRSRPVFILDEPMKWVGKEELDYAGRILKEISSRLGFQLIIVTHEPQLKQIADRAWEVERKKYSVVKLVVDKFNSRRKKK